MAWVSMAGIQGVTCTNSRKHFMDLSNPQKWYMKFHNTVSEIDFIPDKVIYAFMSR